MAQVQMPDGAVVEMPDQLDPALGQRLRAFHNAQTQAPGSVPAGTGSGLKETAKEIGMAPVGAAEELLKGATSALASVPAGVAYGGAAVGKAFGADVDPSGVQSRVHDALTYQPHTESGRAADAALKQTYAPVGDSIAHAGDALASKVGQVSPTAEALLREAPAAASAAGAVLPAVGAAGAGISAARDAAAATAGAKPIFEQAGFRTAAEHPVASGIAGGTGKEALTLHNQQIGNALVGGEAGVPHGHPLTYGNLENARAAPDAVYQRAGAFVPAGPLSPKAQALVQAAGGSGGEIVRGTPEVGASIDALKAQFLDPHASFSGEGIVNNLRNQRQEGYARIGSDDVSQQALGKAQLEIARALEQHIADSIPPNSTVSMDQLTAARTALAKNHAVSAALRGNNVDLQAVARLQRADPDLLTGGLQTTADFANAHPGVSGLANRIETPPSIGRDMGTALSSGSHQDIMGRLFGGMGLQAGARRVLTGDTDQAVQSARQMFPGRLGEEFAPMHPGELQLQHPLGTVFEPAQRDLGPLPQGPPPREGLELTQPPGTVFEPAQRDFGALPEGPGAPETLGLAPPLGNAFDPHQHGLPFEPVEKPAKPEKGKKRG